MRVKRFEIIFDNQERAYFAGVELTGKVSSGDGSGGSSRISKSKSTFCLQIHLELAEAKNINEILLELKGRQVGRILYASLCKFSFRAKTYWTKHSGKSRTHLTNSESYFCQQIKTNFTHSFSSKPTADGKTFVREKALLLKKLCKF